MTSTDALARLGDAIRARRKSRGMTVRQAAAKMPKRDGKAFSASAWSAIENARNAGPSHPGTYAEMEDLLGWELGSCASILSGGDPTVAAPANPESAATVVTELSSPGDRLLVVAASWDKIDELNQRRIVEIARQAHEKAHGSESPDSRLAR